MQPRAVSACCLDNKVVLIVHLFQPPTIGLLVASVDSRGFWGALTGILKRRNTQRKASMEKGMYLDDFDYDSMDPDELSKFFPSRWEVWRVCVCVRCGVWRGWCVVCVSRI